MKQQGLYVLFWPWERRATGEVVVCTTIGKAESYRERCSAYRRDSVRRPGLWNPAPGLETGAKLIQVPTPEFTRHQLWAAECKLKSQALLVAEPLTPRHSEVFVDLCPHEAIRMAHQAIAWTRQEIEALANRGYVQEIL